jgi:hypothetical protein
MKKALLLGLACAWLVQAQAQLRPHPRIWVSDDRHGSSLLETMKAKARAGSEDWRDLIGWCDRNFTRFGPNNPLNLQYATPFALAYLILRDEPSRYGANRAAEAYAATARSLAEDGINYGLTVKCNNSFLPISGCEYSQDSPDDWKEEQPNLWYTNRTARTGQTGITPH